MEAVPQKINWVGIVRAHSNLGKGQIGAISSETYENKKRQKPDSELKYDWKVDEGRKVKVN